MTIFENCKIITQKGSNEQMVLREKYLKSKYKEGRCYSRCLIENEFEVESKEYAIYLGNELREKVDIEIKEIIISFEEERWVKKKSGNNSSQDKGFIYCVTKYPEVKKEIKILIDTTQSKNYIMQRINFDEIIDEYTEYEWKEVLCEKSITPAIINQIQNSLRQNGYFKGDNTNIMDFKTKTSLSNFQKNNNLPIGHLDIETTDALGIVGNK